MRKVWVIIVLLVVGRAYAVEKVRFPDSFADGWDQYVGKMVQITTPLYVCGNYYDSLILSPDRLYVPEERAYGLAEGDSTEYWAIKKREEEEKRRLEREAEAKAQEERDYNTFLKLKERFEGNK